MKNKMTKKKMIIYGVTSFILSLFVYRAADAANMNIAKDAEARKDLQTRCMQSQERTEALVKSANDRLEFEANKNLFQQKKLADLHDDDRASYLNFVIIDRSQALTDIEAYLEKISRRLDLIQAKNICTGIADNSKHEAELREASRKLQEKHAELEKKVSPTTND
jgi:hypothetical protein